MRYSLGLLFLSTFFISCEVQNESEKRLIEDAIYSLERSNEALEGFSTEEARVFKNKLYDPMQANKAMQWQNTVDSIIEVSDNVILLINKFKVKYFDKSKTSKFSNSKDAVVNFKKEGEDGILFKQINNYQTYLLFNNKEINETFQKEINLAFKDFLDLKDADNYSKIHLSKMLNNQFYLKLTDLENRINSIKYKSLVFCNNKCDIIRCLNFEKFAAIVGQNSNVFRKGQKVEISVGVGEFSTSAMPNISISNRKIEVSPEGVTIYEFAAPKQKGKYKVPVIIEYTKPDGTKDKKQHTIEYEVVE